MNIKLQISEVVPLVAKRFPMGQIYKQLAPIADQAKIILPELQTGVGYLQWSLPGSGWLSFSELDESWKPFAVQEYQNRKQVMQSKLMGSPLKDVVLTVPSSKYIFFKKTGTNWDIALVAWAYKYPDTSMGDELGTWISKADLQEVNIGFSWDEKFLPDVHFRLDGQPRTTAFNGLFHVDGKLPVGKSYEISTAIGHAFVLTVEHGKSDYIFDLTQYFYVEINVKKDDTPAPNYNCKVQFGCKSLQFVTDASGRVHGRLPLLCDATGILRSPQAECVVSCLDETVRGTPMGGDEVVAFNFSFKSNRPDPEKPNRPDLEKPEVVVTPPDIPEKSKEEEYVNLRILDYEGFPVQDMSVVLITKKKGEIELTTDQEGKCRVLKDWFTHKEKVHVKFVVTQEYMDKHNIHYDKKNTKKG